MTRLKTMQRRLTEADFEIDMQYAVLGLLLIFQAVIPAMQAAVEDQVPVPRPSLTARAIWLGNLDQSVRIGKEVILAENRSGTLVRLDKEFPHSSVAENFTFQLEEESSGELCCWLAELPDFGDSCDFDSRPIRVLIFESSIADEVERAIESGSIDTVMLPGTTVLEIEPGVATVVNLPEEILDLSPSF